MIHRSDNDALRATPVRARILETIRMHAFRWTTALGLLLLWPGLSMAAELDGSQLSVLWGIPFAGILLSIALLPLLTPWFWHHHFGKVAAAWALAFLLPFAVTYGPGI